MGFLSTTGNRKDSKAILRRLQSEFAIAEADRKKFTREITGIDESIRRIKREYALLQAQLSVQEKKKTDLARKAALLDLELKKMKKTMNLL